ncbi:MAG: hypothetical protein K2Z81_09645, partial [Cyanobacteria bacterium]|nr:hypothetical protein [Cyanobacteriota bacterium]
PGISLNTNGKVFLISSGTATTLDKSSGSEFQVTALGDLTVGGTTGGLSADFIHLSTLNNGKITVAKAINGLAGAGTNATSVVLSASGTGSISDTANGSPSIAANTLTLSAFSGNIGANGSPLITNADSFASNTKGSVYINNTNTGLVTVGASSGKDFALKAVNVSLGANSTFSGKASFNTSDFTNPLGTIFTAGQLDITNAGLAAGPLSIKNGGTLVANGVGGSINITSAADQDLLVGNNGGATPGTMQINAGATGINLTATGSSASSSNQVVFTGNQNFIGDTTVNANFPPASKQSVTVQTGVTVQGFSKVTVNSNTLNLQGTLIGNPLIFNSPTGFGTIANSQGNVILSNSSSFIFHGQSLAIIAANN